MDPVNGMGDLVMQGPARQVGANRHHLLRTHRTDQRFLRD